MKVSSIAVALVLFVAGVAQAGGFGPGYTVRYGDFNGDNKRDLAVLAPAPKIVTIDVDDIALPIKLCCATGDLVLLNNGAGSFTMRNGLSTSERAAVAAWALAEELMPYVRDFDQDGVSDLEIVGVKNLIADAWDVALYGNAQTTAPTIVMEGKKHQAYFGQVFAWMKDNNYFDANAPIVMTPGSTPQNARWFASIGDPTNVASIDRFLARCRAAFPGWTCATSGRYPEPPETCVRTADVYDAQGNYLYTTTTNVCDASLYVIRYIGGSVTYQKDYSVFDQEARETADILRRLNMGCHAMPENDQERLEVILESVMARQIYRNMGSADTPNQENHAPFPGDSLFNPIEATFHHYDLHTRMCTLGETNCNMTIVNDTVARYFSFPNYQLKPKWTNVDGVTQETAYITAPYFTWNAIFYVKVAGPITQSWVGLAPWTGAIQNVTAPDHIVYPGTISRFVQEKNGGIEVFTHGMGYNRAYCTMGIDNKPMQVLIGRGNDQFGPKAFGQLDIEMRKYWKKSYRPSGYNKIEPTGVPTSSEVVLSAPSP